MHSRQKRGRYGNLSYGATVRLTRPSSPNVIASEAKQSPPRDVEIASPPGGRLAMTVEADIFIPSMTASEQKSFALAQIALENAPTFIHHHKGLWINFGDNLIYFGRVLPMNGRLQNMD